MLLFEQPGGGAHPVPASEVAAVLAAARVPVVVLNACQSGAVGKAVEAAVATRLLQTQAAVGGKVYTVDDDVHGSVLREPACAADVVSYFDTGRIDGGCAGVPVPSGPEARSSRGPAATFRI